MSAREEIDLHGTVLVIEDSALVANVVVSMLEELGFSAKAVKNVEEGLLIIDREYVKIIVSDIELPGLMNGHAFAFDLRQSRPELPMILMTGNAGRAAEAERDFVVLKKPFGLQDLRVAIQKVMISGEHVA